MKTLMSNESMIGILILTVLLIVVSYLSLFTHYYMQIQSEFREINRKLDNISNSIEECDDDPDPGEEVTDQSFGEHTAPDVVSKNVIVLFKSGG